MKTGTDIPTILLHVPPTMVANTPLKQAEDENSTSSLLLPEKGLSHLRTQRLPKNKWEYLDEITTIIPLEMKTHGISQPIIFYEFHLIALPTREFVYDYVHKMQKTGEYSRASRLPVLVSAMSY